MNHGKKKKGVLLTLVTLVLFILMLGELITYVVITINYDQLSSTGASALDSSTFLNFISGSAPSFLSTSLSSAVSALTTYEGTPSLRQYHFINNTALALSGLMNNGTLYGSNSVSSYMEGETLQAYENVLYNKAASVGANLSLSNLSISVFQSSPFYLSARLLGSAVLNSSTGTTTFPIDVVGNLSLNGTKDLLSVQNGNPIAIKSMPNYQFTTLIGNTLAVSGSRSPYRFVYAPAIYSSSGCPGTAPAFNYILFTPTWSGGSLCTNMVGLVTDSASSPPLVPYLVYNGVNIFNNIPSGTSVLLNGAGLSVLGLDGIQKGIQQGYYFGSNSSPSYLQTSEVSTTRGSENGLFSFNLLNRQAAQFNGENSISTPLQTVTSSFTIVLWVNAANTLKMESSNGYTLFNSGGTNNFQMWLNNGGGVGATPGNGDEELGLGTNYYHGYGINGGSWNMVAVSISNGKANFYANGAGPYTISVISGPYSFNSLAISQSAAGISQFTGYISNVQIYNTSLTPAQVSQLYIRGIDAPPLTNSSLIAWYPLSGNANDYSGYNNNGTPYNVIYSAMPGFTEDPIFNTVLNRYHSSVVKGVLNCDNLNQCSNAALPHLYLGARSLSVSNGNVLNETSALGLVNGSVPNAVLFSGGDVEANSIPANVLGSNSKTVSAWVYPTSYSSESGIVVLGPNGGGNAGQSFRFVIDSSGDLGLDVSNGVAYSTLVVPLNSWSFVTATYGGGSYQVYLNTTGQTISGLPVQDLAAGNLGIGYNFVNSIPFYGYISDVQLYDAQLSQSQIQSLFQNNSISGNTLVGDWPLSSYIPGTYNKTADTVAGDNATFYNSSGGACSAQGVLRESCGAVISQP